MNNLVGPDGGRAAQGLAKVAVDGRPRDGLEPLHLSRRGHVELLDEVEDEGDGDDDDDENGEGEDDGDEGADDLEGEAEEHAEVHGDGDVHDVDLLGETIEDPADGRRVEEGHGGADDAGE